jgi:hypothetical protein
MNAKEELSAIHRLVCGGWEESVKFDDADGHTLNRVKELMHYSQKYAHLSHCEDCDASKAAATATNLLSKVRVFRTRIGEIAWTYCAALGQLVGPVRMFFYGIGWGMGIATFLYQALDMLK